MLLTLPVIRFYSLQALFNEIEDTSPEDGIIRVEFIDNGPEVTENFNQSYNSNNNSSRFKLAISAKLKREGKSPYIVFYESDGSETEDPIGYLLTELEEIKNFANQKNLEIKPGIFVL